MNRRCFIKGLIRVGAFAAFNPHRVIFDMAKGLYLPEPGTYAAINRAQYPDILRSGSLYTVHRPGSANIVGILPREMSRAEAIRLYGPFPKPS
jgi:hypothetical protein